MLRRVHGGDPQHIADSRIRRRTTPLAEDALVVRDPHDIVDREKIARIFKLLDQGELCLEQLLDLFRQALGVAHGGVAPCQFLQPALGIPAGRDGLIRVLVFQLVEIEFDAGEKVARFCQSLRAIGEETGHFGRRLQVPLRIHFQQAARIFEGPPLAMQVRISCKSRWPGSA